MNVELVTIGASGVRTSRIGLGTWEIGGWLWGGADDDAAVATIARALDAGVSLIDTSPVYGHGHSEEIVGRALRGKRAAATIATKCGIVTDPGDGIHVHRDASAGRIEIEIEQSLRRLQTDYIDLYQIHWPDESHPIEETALAMKALLDAGKIRAIGVSNFSPAQMDEFSRYAPLHAVQSPYNLFERAIDDDVLPYVRKTQTTLLTYGSLCRSLLGGRIRAGTVFPDDDIRRADPKFQPPRLAHYLRAVERIEALARSRFGKSIVDVAVRWVLDTPGVGAALWGMRKPDEVDAVAGVAGFTLTASDRHDIERIVDEEVRDPVGPEFMSPPPATA